MPSVLGKRLAELRKKHKLSGQRLAEKIGVTQAYISHIENAETPSPKIDLITKIAQIFGVSVAYLMGETDTPAPVSAPAPAETETSAAQLLRAAFAQRESAERCENSMSVPRLIAAIAQLRAELSELDHGALSCSDLRTISDLLAACQLAVQETACPHQNHQNKKLA